MSALNAVADRSRKLWRELSWAEVSGSLGDLGTFMPLLVGLVEARGLDLGTTLIFTGLYNVASGLLFGIPMPVQPMKAIVAVALSEVALNVPEIVAGGIFVGVVVFVLGATRLIGLAHSLVPTAVVRGLQLGVGLNLAQKGVSLVWFRDAKAGAIRHLSGSESLFIGLAAAAFILLTVFPYEKLELPFSKQPAPELLESSGAEHDSTAAAPDSADAPEEAPQASGIRVPAALVIVLVGIAMTAGLHPEAGRGIRFGPETPHVVLPSGAEWRRGIWRGGVAQLPLTLLNSVVAVCQLGEELFPGQGPSPALVSMSVGAMNLVGTWFGSMPCCHGAGGLAAQVRFGARSGAAPIFLGLVKLVLGLLFGSSLLQLLRAFPNSLLGAMLLFSGAELASTCRSQKGERGCALMLLTTAAILGTKNTAIGFLAGAGAALLIFLYDRAIRVHRKRSMLRDYRQQESYQPLNA